MNGFLTIVITSPERVEGEAEKIVRLFESGVDYIHIRKPGFSESDIEDLISSIPVAFHRRIMLHDQFRLCDRFRLGGVHLNSRNREKPGSAEKVSTSFHDISELSSAHDYEYVTLSPIYDSISKKGYASAFELSDLKGRLSASNIIALGGVTPEKFHELRQTGFAGAALLGYIWDNDFNHALQGLVSAMKEIDRVPRD